ncbi:hypothetical protein MIMGU_mgv1a014763mg [Erythranthe guttata]|uniref:Non-haem dioxygenase N-terminal domain-containing protein n=2 Tax=Erythranthe guttata TaxID=4155 RepID=A0A022Q4X7_ERYGU|nr:hypothetical protein MIMGU_mgv1a014763mg [Erythranthe guttata]
MDSTLVLCPPFKIKTQNEINNLVFDTSHIEKQPNLPTQFLWPHEDLASAAEEELKQPPVDLTGFFAGDREATLSAAAQIRAACLDHGFFQVVNHGVDPSLVRAAHEQMDAFFKLPVDKKLAVRRKPGGVCGYSGAHADRFSSKLPWKETFSFTYQHNSNGADVVNYIESSLGQDFHQAG